MSKKANKRKADQARKAETLGEVGAAKRGTLRLVRNGALGLGALGAVGFFSVRAVQATVKEADLSTIGHGRPTIVQIHDPTCALCTELQRNTRKALRSLGSEELDYRVANIRTDEGAAFAGAAGVQHVTLMLFDGAGTLRATLEGVRSADDLEGQFARLLQ